jgi:hypothetical protein
MSVVVEEVKVAYRASGPLFTVLPPLSHTRTHDYYKPSQIFFTDAARSIPLPPVPPNPDQEEEEEEGGEGEEGVGREAIIEEEGVTMDEEERGLGGECVNQI